MSTFFQQTAQAMIAKHIDRFPLLKLDQVIDWQPIEQYLNRQKTRYLRDHRGRPAYPLLSMFKAVLLGQWHSLSDPELEHSLITRIDFNLFCRFDELSIPDYSTLCRYRNWLAQDDTLSELLKLINRQLTEKGLKVEKASAAVVDATIIQTAGSKQRQAIEVDNKGQVSGQTTPSKDKDARWTKKNSGGFAFEVQLSLTEKGQYAVAYDLSCKKDCHELHATDPRRTIPHPIPV
ncbi:transposase, partial [Neisseria meningitidis]|uniref:transposase n=1 Tax=Neisseria meningitidis TaxID=487 RepID=UPI003A80E002